MVILNINKTKKLIFSKLFSKNLICEKYAKTTIEQIFEIHAICHGK